MLGNLTIITALLALLYVRLSFGIIRLRHRHKVAFGDGGEAALTRAIRAHANFAEYVPFALGLIWLIAVIAAQPLAATGLAALLLAARLSHAYGLLVGEPKHQKLLGRMVGTATTFTTIGVAALILLVNGFTHTHP